MKVLIPLVSKKENDPWFLEEATAKVKEIILLLVIDTEAMQGQFGFASREISAGNKLLEEVKTLIGQKRKTAKDITEWGPTLQTIENIARLSNVDKIVLKKDENHYFKELVKQLSKNLKKEKIPVEII